MPGFVDAESSGVARISGRGMFSFPIRSSRSIFEAEIGIFVLYLFTFTVFQQGVLDWK